MTKRIRTNSNGKPNLRDLRAAVAGRDDVSVRQQGGDWVISFYSASMRAWMEQPVDPRETEREALERALSRNGGAA